MGRAYQNRKESMAKTSDMKARIYSRYGRDIYMSAKSGGTDPDGNLSLRSLIERAKRDQVPTHVIEKAIAKANGPDGEDFAAARYEGFGPGNCMVIVDCLTDNPNRTYADVRQAFIKTKSKIGTPGVVAHMFDHAAVMVFPGHDEEAVLEALMEADVDVMEIESDENEMVSVLAPAGEHHKALSALNTAFGEIKFEVEEVQFVPKGETAIGADDREMFDKFMQMLNELDDVQNIYTDAQLPEAE